MMEGGQFVLLHRADVKEKVLFNQKLEGDKGCLVSKGKTFHQRERAVYF